MEVAEKIQTDAKLNLDSMLSQLSKDIELAENLFKDVVVMDGSPAQIYSHLSGLSAELDQINKITGMMRQELENI